jgi:hypothetical protein
LDLLSPETDVVGADALAAYFLMSTPLLATDSSEPLGAPWIPLDGATACFEAVFTSLLFVVF